MECLELKIIPPTYVPYNYASHGARTAPTQTPPPPARNASLPTVHLLSYATALSCALRSAATVSHAAPSPASALGGFTNHADAESNIRKESQDPRVAHL
jgi:hypothetical protein